MSEKENELYTKGYIDKANYLVARVANDKSGINFDHSKSYDFVDMAYDFLDSLGISNIMADNYTNESLWNDYVDYVEKHCSKYEIDENGYRLSEKTYIVNYCPFCGSENIEWMGESYGTDDFHCHECDKWFGVK